MADIQKLEELSSCTLLATFSWWRERVFRVGVEEEEEEIVNEEMSTESLNDEKNGKKEQKGVRSE